MNKILQNLRADLEEYAHSELVEGSDLPIVIAPMEILGDRARRQWDYESPETIYERNDFYMRTKHYLSECTDWHSKDTILQQWGDTLISAALDVNFGPPWTSVMDYGSGIATHSLVLAESSKTVRVTLSDFECPAMEFARWKVEKYGLDVDFYIFDPLISVQMVPQLFDCIICTDVIGHSSNPYKMLLEILTHARYVLWNSDFRVSPSDRYPMHCVKPSMWDWLWNNSVINVGPFLYRSFLYEKTIQEVVDALDLTERLDWIDI